MKKILLVIEREYKVRVRKKTFLLTTLFVPIIIMGFYIAMIKIGMSESTEQRHIAILDSAGLFGKKSQFQTHQVDFSIISNETAASFGRKYVQSGFDAFICIPALDLQRPGKLTLQSETNLDILTMSAVQNTIRDAITDKQLETLGISKEAYALLKPEVKIENKVTNEKGSNTNIAEIGFFASFLCGILIYMMMLIYGTQVMRGVMEEKTSRISEVIISSVKPFELMMGKIIGIGAVGLTQFLIWIMLMFLLHGGLPIFLPSWMEQGNGNEPMMLQEVMTGIQALPILKILLSFVFFFLAGFLTYSAMFAAIGSVVGDDQQDAQQLMFPVMMPIILGFVIMTKAAQDPNSSLAIIGSYFPLTSPIVMMGRVTYDIPWWEIGLSMGLLILCFVLLTWISGRVYRIGILMYGKKPSWKELIKWAFGRSA